MSQASSTTAQPQASSQPLAAPPAEAPMTIQQDDVWLPQASSTFAEPHDWAWNFNLWVSVVFFVIVIGPMGYFAFKYKRKSEDERTSPVDHNLKLELFWTLIPTVLLIYMFWVGFKLYAHAQVAPNDAMVIKVTGQMFNWTFEYPDGTVTTELGVPKGRPVKLIMSSKDTIHAFYVPEFRLKQDVVPNLYTTMWFEATREMESTVECAEYCGDGHSRMLTRVFVLPSGDKSTPGTFETWLDNGGLKTPLPPMQLGQKRYTALCSSCHSLDGSKVQGPTFKGLFGRQETLQDGSTVTVDENYVRNSILNPQAQIVKDYPATMPTFTYLKDRDIEGIITFLKEQK
jgi:cytochrome c oxidase subunit 2